jgi:proteasome non-ATPase regulatory subunit RPN1-like protein
MRHEYIRRLASELSLMFQLLTTESHAPPPPAADGESAKPDQAAIPVSPNSKPLEMRRKFFVSHNAEAGAVDLLEEIEQIGRINDVVDDVAFFS